MDAGVGRFISEDTLINIEEPLTLHMYLYGTNSPAEFTDPFGLHRVSQSCNNPPFNRKDIMDAAADWCNSLNTNSRCKNKIMEIGGKGLMNCLKRQCRKKKGPSIICDCKLQDCGQGGVFGITLGPLAGTGMYPGLVSTIGHESFHLCEGRFKKEGEYFDMDSELIAKQIEEACKK